MYFVCKINSVISKLCTLWNDMANISTPMIYLLTIHYSIILFISAAQLTSFTIIEFLFLFISFVVVFLTFKAKVQKTPDSWDWNQHDQSIPKGERFFLFSEIQNFLIGLDFFLNLGSGYYEVKLSSIFDVYIHVNVLFKGTWHFVIAIILSEDLTKLFSYTSYLYSRAKPEIYCYDRVD